MFVDQVKVKLIAGKGGNGIVAWRREKYLPKGGPYGGNGGRGGNVVFEADANLYSLDFYRHRKILKAKNGQDGGINLRQGKSGVDLKLKVPYGTLIKDKATGEVLVDFTLKQKSYIACTGGRGGKGNHAFKTSTNQAPNTCTLGTLGDEKEFELELKLIADVGLVGMPNAGKSTLLSQITHARVKTGAYPFTTLTPNLSYMQNQDYTRLLIADIPGIIENAHLNKGLGFQFLRHIERTSILLILIDISGEEGRDPCQDYAILQNELNAYRSDMLEKPVLVALNKIDKEESKEHIIRFKKAYPTIPSYEICATEGKGLKPLMMAMNQAVAKMANRENQPA